jgi:hypothetical protein
MVWSQAPLTKAREPRSLVDAWQRRGTRPTWQPGNNPQCQPHAFPDGRMSFEYGVESDGGLDCFVGPCFLVFAPIPTLTLHPHSLTVSNRHAIELFTSSWRLGRATKRCSNLSCMSSLRSGCLALGWLVPSSCRSSCTRTLVECDTSGYPAPGMRESLRIVLAWQIWHSHFILLHPNQPGPGSAEQARCLNSHFPGLKSVMRT